VIESGEWHEWGKALREIALTVVKMDEEGINVIGCLALSENVDTNQNYGEKPLIQTI
jgi:hypothetical protein